MEGDAAHLRCAEVSAAPSRGVASSVDSAGASTACCCRMWKMTVESGRASGSGERQSLISTAMSSGHSSGNLQTRVGNGEAV